MEFLNNDENNNLTKIITSVTKHMLLQTFQENVKLQSFFSMLSTNVADNGVHFVSTIEGYKIIIKLLWQKLSSLFDWVVITHLVSFFMLGKRYPFYGVQWHPEVNRFQWDRKKNFPHSRHAVQLSSLLAEFFVNEGQMTNTHCTFYIQWDDTNSLAVNRFVMLLKQWLPSL